MNTFPLDWAIKTNVVDRATKLNAFLENAAEIKNKIESLKKEKHGANWLYLSLKNFQRTVSPAIYDKIDTIAKLDDDSDDSSIDFADLKRLNGLTIFAHDIRSVLIDNILRPLIDLEDCDKETQTPTKMARHCSWVDTVDDQFKLAESLVEQGRLFFSRSNIELFGSLINSKKQMYKLIEFQSKFK